MEPNTCCCTHKSKQRTPEEERDLVNRLSRIEGQIRERRLTKIGRAHV